MNKNIFRSIRVYLFLSFSILGFDACTKKANEPVKEAPSNLLYSPSSISAAVGASVVSVKPSISGTSPIIYTSISSPPTANITIDANTGVISASNSLKEGTYQVNVTAKNDVGSKEFTQAYSIVISSTSSKITFDGNIKSILSGNCAPCHGSGGGETNYTIYSTSKANIDAIINRVNRTPGASGFMPFNGVKLSAVDLNALAQWKTDGLLEK